MDNKKKLNQAYEKVYAKWRTYSNGIIGQSDGLFIKKKFINIHIEPVFTVKTPSKTKNTAKQYQT